MKIKVVRYSQYEDPSGVVTIWINRGWTPHFPVQVTNDRGKIDYHVTLTKEE